MVFLTILVVDENHFVDRPQARQIKHQSFLEDLEILGTSKLFCKRRYAPRNRKGQELTRLKTKIFLYKRRDRALKARVAAEDDDRLGFGVRRSRVRPRFHPAHFSGQAAP